MQFVIEGLVFGLFLSVSMGPIFIALTLTSIEKGLGAGMVVGSGVWSSDIAIVTCLFLFINSVKTTIESASFNFWVSVVGGLILVIYGIKLFFHKGKLNFNTKSFSAKNYIGFWLKGFFVNTLNPFTPIFWIGVVSTYILGRGIDAQNTLLFLGSIIFMIIFSDSVKIILASWIRKRLNDNHFRYITSFSGLIMVGLGIYLGGKEIYANHQEAIDQMLF